MNNTQMQRVQEKRRRAVLSHRFAHGFTGLFRNPWKMIPLLLIVAVVCYLANIRGNLFLVALFTGMRQGELLGLSWDAVDFKSGIITVKQQLQRKDGAYFLCTPKSGKPRMIAPAPFVLDALKQEQRKQQENRKNAGSLWENKWNLVFTDAIGKNLVRRTVDKHFKNIVENSGLESCRFHDLRHTYAVNSLQAGDDIKTVQANLGHATASFTLDV